MTHYLKELVHAYKFGKDKPGISQTASVKSPYIYAEENWVDDMELAGIAIFNAMKKWINR